MDVDRTYSEEGFLCHRETSFELEPSGAWKTKTEKELEEREEEVEIVGNIWRELNMIAGNKVCWCCFMEAL
jgi:hypothetical protein